MGGQTRHRSGGSRPLSRHAPHTQPTKQYIVGSIHPPHKPTSLSKRKRCTMRGPLGQVQQLGAKEKTEADQGVHARIAHHRHWPVMMVHEPAPRQELKFPTPGRWGWVCGWWVVGQGQAGTHAYRLPMGTSREEADGHLVMAVVVVVIVVVDDGDGETDTSDRVGCCVLLDSLNDQSVTLKTKRFAALPPS